MFFVISWTIFFLALFIRHEQLRYMYIFSVCWVYILPFFFYTLSASKTYIPTPAYAIRIPPILK